MQGSKLANAQREDGNVCRLFIELAVNWAEDYNATPPAYDKDTFSLAHCSICSVFGPILLIIPISTHYISIPRFPLRPVFSFYLSSVCNLPVFICRSAFHFRYLPLSLTWCLSGDSQTPGGGSHSCALCWLCTVVRPFGAAACAVTGC